MNSNLPRWLVFKAPQTDPQTWYDHEEWSRFWLSLLSDAEFQKWNYNGSMQYFTAEELLNCARTHLEAAELLKRLDALHDDDDEDTDD